MKSRKTEVMNQTEGKKLPKIQTVIVWGGDEDGVCVWRWWGFARLPELQFSTDFFMQNFSTFYIFHKIKKKKRKFWHAEITISHISSITKVISLQGCSGGERDNHTEIVQDAANPLMSKSQLRLPSLITYKNANYSCAVMT